MENIVYSTSVFFGRAVSEMIYQGSLPLNIFAKSVTCPSAEGLLAFSKSVIATAQTQLVAAHLDKCDFCRAELQLLERFPYKPEAVAVAEMPPSVRLLAESILGNLRRTPPPFIRMTERAKRLMN